MKIEYMTSKKDFPKLSELPEGTVFSPTDSDALYIVTPHTAMDDLFADTMSNIEQNMEDWQSLGYNSVEELVAVVNISCGGIMFLPCKTQVKPIDCKLVVEK